MLGGVEGSNSAAGSRSLTHRRAQSSQFGLVRHIFFILIDLDGEALAGL